MKKPLFNKVCIIGLGLIGGSLAKALKKKRLCSEIIGFTRGSRNPSIFKNKRDVVDMISENHKKDLKGADLVILCMPILTNLDWIKEHAHLLDKNTLVMDVGSTKRNIQVKAEEFLGKDRFVGCHPMAGSEKKGIPYAHENLFNGSSCFMTASNKKIESLWRAIGAKPKLLTPSEHDMWVARISHMPHVVAFMMVRMVGDLSNTQAFLSSIGSMNPSFKSIARIAKSDPRIWTDIFLSNKDEILSALTDFEVDIKRFKTLLRNKGALEKIHGQVMAWIKTANQRTTKLMPDDEYEKEK